MQFCEQNQNHIMHSASSALLSFVILTTCDGWVQLCKHSRVVCVSKNAMQSWAFEEVTTSNDMKYVLGNQVVSQAVDSSKLYTGGNNRVYNLTL